MFLHSLPVFLHIKISLRKLEPLYFNKDQVCFLKMTLNFSIFSVLLNFIRVICIYMKVLLFTSGLECENYRNTCNFRDVYILVMILHNVP